MSTQKPGGDGHHFDLGEFAAGADARAVGPGEKGAGCGLADAFERQGRCEV